ncbi:metallophosphatase family protein [Desulfovibrio sp. OttesenSCG-928-C14]|nr:metallophosphatase family protein [Desulfovibrio sp. OttesenSCG-928-C14]
MIGIVSDIHGNYEALRTVLRELKSLRVKTIVCLGDIAGYYSQINQCCETLRKMDVAAIMGNHDWYLVSGQGCPRSNSANACLDYQRRVISPDNLKWLSSLPRKLSLKEISMRHGGWDDPLDEYIKPSAEYFEGTGLKQKLFASGHTHVPYIWKSGAFIYCNPGSVGQPRDGNPEAAYALYDGESFTIRREPYDIGATQKCMKEAGFTEYFYENLSSGTRIGGKIDTPETVYGSALP